MKHIKTKNAGITLIALVLTIIVLLILAGISIATLTGSGLFENAKLAKEKSENSQKKEEQISLFPFRICTIYSCIPFA